MPVFQLTDFVLCFVLYISYMCLEFVCMCVYSMYMYVHRLLYQYGANTLQINTQVWLKHALSVLGVVMRVYCHCSLAVLPLTQAASIFYFILIKLSKINK